MGSTVWLPLVIAGAAGGFVLHPVIRRPVIESGPGDLEMTGRAAVGDLSQ
ncbi:hypothetical protein OHA40_10870 [Nocardia sp. NBC_00508]|nr:hypothetical protein [Nocardia sp. NBC_00508]WUD68560.1 hypothetical protein OHA40_10870 [Nocardia sp. NBC_00508]